mmetsp:Transcript_29865/g.85520  ORF Transcript_29865/g.85520 Transcript_29865/m.85520 type:complete len:1039 (+) Transcript_29865:141-3257(+)
MISDVPGTTCSGRSAGSGIQQSTSVLTTTSSNTENKSLSRQTTGESVLDAIQDPDSLVFDAAHSRIQRCGFRGYLAACLLVTLSISLLAVYLWSDLGCGPRCLDFLREHSRLQPLFGGVMGFVLLTLYLLDFFCPPHLPEIYCSLSENGSVLGRFFLCIAFLAFLALCFLLAKQFPTLPFVVTIFLCPVSVMLLRQATMPRERFVRGLSRASSSGGPPKLENQGSVGSVKRKGFELRMEMLKMLTGEERDQKDFYLAATGSFVIAGFVCLIVWIPWAANDGGEFNRQMITARGKQERELIFVRWASPLIVATSNFVFASFTGLRVALNRAYTATDQVRNRLIIGGTKSCMNQEMMNHRINMLKTRLEGGEHTPQDVVQQTQDKMQQYLVQHISHMRQLSNIVKSVGCAFGVFLGALYVAFQLTAADSHLAFMVQGFLGAFLLTFMLVVFVSFGRLWQVMKVWLTDLPLWKSAAGLCRKDWAIAFGICLAFPFMPLVLALSALNQRVRCFRGLCKDGEAERRRCLTERVRDMLASMREWNWVRVIFWCYVVATIMMIYKMTPLFLNVLLAWMTWTMRDLDFVWICVATFLAGMVLFMLPPIPGPPIYLFGGVVISERCPWGFWWGSLVCIILCFVLKLTACAMQQKIFGEGLGTMKSVRQAVGVHKPFIRAIEMVLRRPGLSFGKCMILCGGPDWPTSVLAGILRISLRQCLVGTFPIIFNVVPLTLTGSFYLKRDESQVWVRAGNLMFSLTALISVVFWVGMGWAIQDVFEREHENLTRAKEEYIDLEWLDFRSSLIAAKTVVVWSDLPLGIKVVYVGGAMGLSCVGVAFFWRSALCFGNFKLTDKIQELVWFGNRGLIKTPGVIGLSIAGASYMGLAIYRCWASKRSRRLQALAAKEVDALEVDWKQQRLLEARTATDQPPTPRGFGSSDLPTSSFEVQADFEDAVTSAANINSMELGEEALKVPTLAVQRTSLTAAAREGQRYSGAMTPIQESSPSSTTETERGFNTSPLHRDTTSGVVASSSSSSNGLGEAKWSI